MAEIRKVPRRKRYTGKDTGPAEIHVDPIEACWALADLSYLLHEGQVGLRHAWRASQARKFVVCCSRRYGKSTWLAVEAWETALLIPGAQIRYAAPTQKMVRTIIEPLFREVGNDCPARLRPDFKRNDGVWRFHNGSEIHVAGCDKSGAERLRGVSTHLAIVDEAGFVDQLRYVVQDILLPQTLTVDGRILIVSTPSRTPAHPFADYCSEAETTGNYVHRTIHDAPHIRPFQVLEYIEESGGIDGSTWRREYLAQHVVDRSIAVVPEFADHESSVVGELPVPLYRDLYVSGDLAFHDLTVLAFAYYDWQAGKIIVEDELVCHQSTASAIDEEVAQTETRLWGEKHAVYRRVVDAPPLVVAEMRRSHGRSWQAARADEAQAALNALRTAIERHQILINPRCRTLIAHMRHAVWNKNKSSYARTDGYGHYDGVDALKYLVRHVDLNKNPYPRWAEGVRTQTHWLPPPGPANGAPASHGFLHLVRSHRKRK